MHTEQGAYDEKREGRCRRRSERHEERMWEKREIWKKVRLDRTLRAKNENELNTKSDE